MGTRAHEWPVAENSFRSSEPARADQFWGPAYQWKRAIPRWPVAENCIVALLDQTIRGTDAWPYTLTDLEGQLIVHWLIMFLFRVVPTLWLTWPLELIVQPCRTFLSTCRGVFRKWNNPRWTSPTCTNGHRWLIVTNDHHRFFWPTVNTALGSFGHRRLPPLW